MSSVLNSANVWLSAPLPDYFSSHLIFIWLINLSSEMDEEVLKLLQVLAPSFVMWNTVLFPYLSLLVLLKIVGWRPSGAFGMSALCSCLDLLIIPAARAVKTEVIVWLHHPKHRHCFLEILITLTNHKPFCILSVKVSSHVPMPSSNSKCRSTDTRGKLS